MFLSIEKRGALKIFGVLHIDKIKKIKYKTLLSIVITRWVLQHQVFSSCSLDVVADLEYTHTESSAFMLACASQTAPS